MLWLALSVPCIVVSCVPIVVSSISVGPLTVRLVVGGTTCLSCLVCVLMLLSGVAVVVVSAVVVVELLL